MPLEHEWDLKSVEFPLNEDSVVFEIGGYEGRWSVEISKLYHPKLYVFEPQHWAWKKCTEALKPFESAHVYNFGLGTKSGEFQMGNWETDGCSFSNIPDNRPVGYGNLQEVTSFLKKEDIRRIDLCLMNIEGYEFELIPYMIRTGVIDRIHFFMCQFHTFKSEDDQAYYDLRRRISVKKKIRFDYGKVLTCWESR